MAKVDTIDVVTGLHGKYGTNRKDYFATNSSSNQIRLARLNNPYQGEPTQRQKDHMEAFKTRALQATAWLNANKELRDSDGNVTRQATDAYKEAQRIKRQLALSNVRQVVCKYMDEDGNVTLPASGTSSGGTSGGSNSGGTSTVKRTLTLSASPSNGGSVSGGGQYNNGASATISATANSGYTFTEWSDGETSPNRVITMNSDKTLTATFTANAGGSENQGGEVNNLH